MSEVNIPSIPDLGSRSDEITIFAGPCSVESVEQFDEVAACVAGLGLTWIRGGAFKPRTNPHSFQGLGEEALKIMRDAGEKHGLKTLTEVMDSAHCALVHSLSLIHILGAIMAVLILYFHKLNPFSPKKTSVQKKSTWRLWGMVAIGCIPAAIIGLLFDDWVNEHFYNKVTVAAMLIVYGVAFIVLERRNRRRLREAEAALAAPRGRHARQPYGDVADEAEAQPVSYTHLAINATESGRWTRRRAPLGPA